MLLNCGNNCGKRANNVGNVFRRWKKAENNERRQKLKCGCGKITQKAFYDVFPLIKEGITEIELKDLLENKMLQLGAEKTSFETIVAFGKNSAIPHHKTSNQKLHMWMEIIN